MPTIDITMAPFPIRDHYAQRRDVRVVRCHVHEATETWTVTLVAHVDVVNSGTLHWKERWVHYRSMGWIKEDR